MKHIKNFNCRQKVLDRVKSNHAKTIEFKLNGSGVSEYALLFVSI